MPEAETFMPWFESDRHLPLKGMLRLAADYMYDREICIENHARAVKSARLEIS